MSDWADGPAAYEHLVSSLYAMAPDNPFDLALPPAPRYCRHVEWYERPGPVRVLADMTTDEQLTVLLRYDLWPRLNDHHCLADEVETHDGMDG